MCHPNGLLFHQKSSHMGPTWCCTIALPYSQGKAYLSKQLLWCPAGDPHLACPMGMCPPPRARCMHFFLHPPFLPPSGDSFLLLSHHPCESVRVIVHHAVGPGFEPRSPCARCVHFFSPPSLPSLLQEIVFSHLPQPPTTHP